MSNKFKLAMEPILEKMYESPRAEYYMNTFPMLVSLEFLEDDNFDNDDKKIEKFCTTLNDIIDQHNKEDLEKRKEVNND